MMNIFLSQSLRHRRTQTHRNKMKNDKRGTKEIHKYIPRKRNNSEQSLLQKRKRRMAIRNKFVIVSQDTTTS